jgi:Raf kinase inhibitor-like YbhB/YbcL family protein
MLIRFAARFVAAIAVFAVALNVAGRNASGQQSADNKSDHAFTLTSTGFESDGAIPATFACTGANASPALFWTDPPAGTESFVLVVDDPDVPSGTAAIHWTIYDIPGSARSLAEALPRKGKLPDGSRQGKNVAGKIGYSGPCPDPGKVHHYFFNLYALDYTPDLKAKVKFADVEAALKGHVLAKTELIGRFERQ